MERKFNFSAGPGTLPEAVLREAQEEMLVYKAAGASIMEISHRSPEYTAVADAARNHIRNLLGLGDEWHILFLQGGASMQFYQSALNFLPRDGTADYVVTGAWSKKAVKEAARIGNVNIAATSEDSNFSYFPEQGTWNLSPSASYLHFTSNNTIFGTRHTTDPFSDVPLICDASSDFLARPMDLSSYGLIYAGAQKNIGPAGATVVLVRDSFLQSAATDLPTMLSYRTHVEKLFNTPPVFAVYMIEKVLRWLVDLGGLKAIEKLNNAKADALYERIDRTDFYKGTAHPKSRSNMNVTFRLPSEELEAEFIMQAKENGLLALKGHRSVGGIRASVYNACTQEAVDALVSFMDRFESAKG